MTILERPSEGARASWLEQDRLSTTRTFIDLSGPWTLSVNGGEARSVQVPGSVDHEGELLYQRTFTVTDEMLKSAKLEIVALGINNDAEFFINEMFVGKHLGGYVSFTLEIPDDVLQLGPQNVIKIIVSNALTTTSSFPLRKQVWGWKNYGGIVRDLYIRVTPEIWIAGVGSLTTFDAKSGRGRVAISATVSTGAIEIPAAPPPGTKRPPQHQIRFALFDTSSTEPIAESRPIPLVLRPESDTPLEAHLELRSALPWSPESPHRYVLTASIVLPGESREQLIDEVSAMIAFAARAIDKDRIVWNDKALTLKGVVWHEEQEGQGASLTAEQMERDIRMIKTLGANAVRFAFHPPHPLMIELCDRYGLFALEEIPLWNVPSAVMASEAFVSLAEGSVRAMVVRDRSRVSVLAWGLGSQFDDSSPEADSTVRRLAALAKELDGRPVYVGCTGGHAATTSHGTDIAALHVGDAGPVRLERALAEWKEDHPGKPVLLLGYGHPVEFGNRNGYSDPLSEEAQARYFIQTAPIIRDAKISGSFITAFSDWHGDRPILTLPLQSGGKHPLGLVTAGRERTLAYEYVRAIYAGQRTTALPIGSSRSSFPVVHVVAGFVVIFLIAYFYNYNRRFQDCFKRALTRTYNFFSDLRDIRIVSPVHTLLLAFTVALTLGVFASSLLYHFRTDTRLDYLLSLCFSDAVKVPIITLAWDPLLAIAVLTGIFLALLFVAALLLKVLSIVLRSRVRPFHLFTIIIWGGLPMVFLSPVAMALFKVLTSAIYVVPVFLLFAVMVVWCTLRILKGFSVVADVRPLHVYVVSALLLTGVVVGLSLYGEAESALVSYVELFLALVGGLG